MVGKLDAASTCCCCCCCCCCCWRKSNAAAASGSTRGAAVDGAMAWAAIWLPIPGTKELGCRTECSCGEGDMDGVGEDPEEMLF